MNLGSELLRFKKEQIYFLKDYETEGLNLYYSRPWQASSIVFTQTEIIDIQDDFIWFDDLKVSPDAARITGFNYSYYKSKAKDPREVIAKIDKYVYNPNVITLWNNGLRFDNFVHSTLRRLTGFKSDTSYLERSIDTIALAKAYLYGFKVDRENFLEWQYRVSALKLKSNLGMMAENLKVPLDRSRLHDASYDCDINRQVFLKELYKVEI